MVDCNATLDSAEALKVLSDEDVMARAKQLMHLKRTVIASALMHVGEMEARGLPPDFDGWNWRDEDASTFLRAARVMRELPTLSELFQQNEYSISWVAGLDVLLPPDIQAEIHGPEDGDPPEDEQPSRPIRRCQAGPERYRLAFSVDRGVYEKLKLASDLLSEEGEEAPLEEVLALALDSLFDRGPKEG